MKYKKTKYRYNITQKDKKQIWQNTFKYYQDKKVTKQKKAKYKCDRMQKNRLQIWEYKKYKLLMWQNTKQHITNVT